jgi:hypothetical protein
MIVDQATDAVTGYRFRPMRRPDAERVCAWRYGGIYSFHDLSRSAVSSLIEPRFQYHVVEGEDGSLLGYCCFGTDARVRGILYPEDGLDVGLAMAPERTGLGAGGRFAGSVFRFGEATFAPALLRLTVPVFNRRAATTYQRLGFATAFTAEVDRQGVGVQFQVMTRGVEAPPLSH